MSWMVKSLQFYFNRQAIPRPIVFNIAIYSRYSIPTIYYYFAPILADAVDASMPAFPPPITTTS